MDSKNNIINKLYYSLFYVALGVLILIGAIVAIGPFKTNSLAVFIINGLLLPLIFFAGSLFKRYFKVGDVLLFIGCIFAVVVLISTIVTLTQYGFFHTLLYKSTPIYYENGYAYSAVEEAIFIYNLKFTEVSVNYYGSFGILCGAYLPTILFINRKEHKYAYWISLTIGSIGVFSLFAIGLYKAIVILVLVTLGAVGYKQFGKNKKVMLISKWVIIGLFALATLFYIVAGINAAIGFKFTGLFETLFVSNPIMRNVSDILNAATNKNPTFGKLITAFGLNVEYPIGDEVFDIALLKSGIVEVELLKETGPVGVALFMLFVCLAFIGVIKQFNENKNSEHEKVCVSCVLLTFFVYNSLFYDSTPTIREFGYSPFLSSISFMIILFVLGMSFYQKSVEAKEVN